MNEISDINSITITGRLKDDPQIATSSKNIRYATFVVINSQIDSWNNREKLNYIKAVAFGEVNCSILSNMYKNDKILIKGKLDQHLYRDVNNVTKESTKVISSNVYEIDDFEKNIKKTHHLEQKEETNFADNLPF